MTLALREPHCCRSPRELIKLCLLVCKSSIGPAPAYIADMLTAAGDVPSLATLRAASNGDYIYIHIHTFICIRHKAYSKWLHNEKSEIKTTNAHIVPCTNSRFGDRAFSVAAPRVWNRLPADLKTASCSTEVFKRRLKTFLFNCVYCN